MKPARENSALAGRHQRRLGAVLVAGLTWAGAALGGTRPVDLAPGITLLPGSFAAARQPDGNSVVFETPSALIAVDSGRHIEHTQGLLDLAASRKKPLAWLINTHWHLDHLGGNALLRRQAPELRVIASEAVAPALDGWLARSRDEMRGALASGQLDAATRAMMDVDIALIEHGKTLLPDETQRRGETREFAGKSLQVGHALHAVTAADLWLFDAASGVLVAGDLLTLPVPFLDTACPAGWRRALDTLAAVPFKTVVPGHGAPLDRAGFERYRSAFGNLLDCAAGPGESQSCVAAWIEALGPLLDARDMPRTRGMAAYYVGEVLRAPAAQRDRYCGG